MGEFSPDRLPARLAKEQEEAFAEAYDRYARRLYRTALAALGRREDAEDAVQEVFASLVRSRRQLAAVRNLSAYLFVALRRAAGRIASRRALQPITSDDTCREAASPASLPGPMDNHRLVRALAELPPEQREVISLKIDGELTFAQIGEVLQISPNTAASRYRYALEKLRSRLAPPNKPLGQD